MLGSKLTSQSISAALGFGIYNHAETLHADKFTLQDIPECDLGNIITLHHSLCYVTSLFITIKGTLQILKLYGIDESKNVAWKRLQQCFHTES